MTNASHRYAVFETEAGFCAIGWTEAGIARFQLPDTTSGAAERNMLRRFPSARRDTPPPPVAAVIAAAQRYFAGEVVDFSGAHLFGGRSVGVRLRPSSVRARRASAGVGGVDRAAHG